MFYDYLAYISVVKRYSQRTVAIYGDVLSRFAAFAVPDDYSDEQLLESLDHQTIRSYEVHLLDAEKLSARTVNQHLSVLSGFCRYLVKQNILKSNPAALVKRPKVAVRLPEFYKDEPVQRYFEQSAHSASREELDVFLSFGERICVNSRNGLSGSDARDTGVPDSDICGSELSSPSGTGTARNMYERRLRRLIVSLLHATGLRRAELVSLDTGSVDFHRGILRVRGKGDKEREIPMVSELCDELRLYLEASEFRFGSIGGPLLRTWSGARLYPGYVDRAVKKELGGVDGITLKKSPHVLRHTIATELLNGGTDLNSIKEFLGHSSLAATQIYTHNSIERLKSVYNSAHPRAKEKQNK